MFLQFYIVWLLQKLATSTASCTAQAIALCELRTLLGCGQLQLMASASLQTEADDPHYSSQQGAPLPAESRVR